MWVHLGPVFTFLPCPPPAPGCCGSQGNSTGGLRSDPWFLPRAPLTLRRTLWGYPAWSPQFGVERFLFWATLCFWELECTPRRKDSPKVRFWMQTFLPALLPPTELKSRWTPQFTWSSQKQFLPFIAEIPHGGRGGSRGPAGRYRRHTPGTSSCSRACTVPPLLYPCWTLVPLCHHPPQNGSNCTYKQELATRVLQRRHNTADCQSRAEGDAGVGSYLGAGQCHS